MNAASNGTTPDEADIGDRVSVAPLGEPFDDLSGWVDYFRAVTIPVYASTAAALEFLRSREDEVDARSIADVIEEDPLMTLKLLVTSGAIRSEHATAEAETVTAALVLMGVGPFFRLFGPQPTVEDWIGEGSPAWVGLEAVIRRAHRAAKFALGLAVSRRDHDAAVIYEAALLHDFAEMLLWCHAPTMASDIRQRQGADPTLRSSKAQQDVLHAELADVQHALMVAWRLPELLTRISDGRHAEQANVKCVTLAVALARHSAGGWDNAAIADDIDGVARLLNLSSGAARALILELDT